MNIRGSNEVLLEAERLECLLFLELRSAVLASTDISHVTSPTYNLGANKKPKERYQCGTFPRMP